MFGSRKIERPSVSPGYPGERERVRAQTGSIARAVLICVMVAAATRNCAARGAHHSMRLVGEQTHADIARPRGIDAGVLRTIDSILRRNSYILRKTGRVAENLQLLEKHAQLATAAYGARSRPALAALTMLGSAYTERGRFADAEKLLYAAFHERQKYYAVTHPGDAAESMIAIAALDDALGRFDEGERRLLQARAMFTKAFGSDHRGVIDANYQLGQVYRDQGRLADAERQMTMVLDARRRAALQKTPGFDDSNIAAAAYVLGTIYRLEGRYREAEAQMRAVLAIDERLYGSVSVSSGKALAVLARIYSATGRAELAIAVGSRAVSVLAQTIGDEDRSTMYAVEALAKVIAKKDPDKAIGYLRNVLAVLQKKYPPDHIAFASPLYTLAGALTNASKFDDAEPLARRALAIQEKVYGSGHPYVGETLTLLGYIRLRLEKADDAAGLLQRALTIAEKAYGPNDRHAAPALWNLSRARRATGRPDEAVVLARRAAALVEASVEQDAFDESAPTGAGEKARQMRDSAFALLEALAAKYPSPPDDILDEALRAAQYAGGADTARVLAGMTARYAAGDGALSSMVRDRQDLAARVRSLDEALVRAVTGADEVKAPAAIAGMRSELQEAQRRISAINARLAAEFPAFVELSSARPAALTTVQSALQPGEAILYWFVGEIDTYVFTIRRDGASFHRADLPGRGARAIVDKLRDSLDAKGRNLVEMPAFDAAKANDLFVRLFGPAKEALADVDRLIVVPTGALQRLPPAVLVTEPPTDRIVKLEDYKSIAWLARKYAISVLPAVSSLPALRRMPALSGGSQFIGFGNPRFGSAASAASRSSDPAPEILFRGGGAASHALGELPPLPDTEAELRAEAAVFGAPESDLFFGANASVSKIRQMNLSGTRILAFATHGLVAGEIPALGEPALAFTPNGQDDGLLRTSDISKLKLGADWVVLSACNTAAADGSSGAEGLSGLAKSFFYAGARALLVSHWRIDSAATVKLMTTTFERLKGEPAIGRAESLRRAMTSMIDDAGRNGAPQYEAHPLYWAPFVHVGADSPRAGDR